MIFPLLYYPCYSCQSGLRLQHTNGQHGLLLNLLATPVALGLGVARGSNIQMPITPLSTFAMHAMGTYTNQQFSDRSVRCNSVTTDIYCILPVPAAALTYAHIGATCHSDKNDMR